MIRHILLVLPVAAAAIAASRPPEIPFEKRAIDIGASETAAIGDVNGDGRLDIVSGEFWYEAPKWTPHRFREIEFANPRTDNYIDNFSDHLIDVNGDGRLDVISCSWFARKLAWWENPGRGAGAWKEHAIDGGFNVEFSFLVDIDNDGRANELLPQFGKGPLVWYEIRNGAFVKYEIAPQNHGHGIGAGDVNGDKRTDVLTAKGWFEAPAGPRAANWTYHPAWDFEKQPGFLHVFDINGDGRNDILVPASHDYGIYWLEQGADGKFTRRVIDESWSQVHATTLVDLNGDGRPDLLAGKRYLGHDRDPGAREPLGVYWYEFRKAADGKNVEWVRHIIDYSTRAGAGMQLPVADLDGDGDLDFVAPGKSGLFLFENLSKRK
jgi:hypothetical protein